MIARIARLAGIPIAELVDLEPAIYHAVHVDAERSEWGTLEELAAGTVELLGLIYALLAGTLGGRKVEPLQIPRPEWARPTGPSSSSSRRFVMRAGDVAEHMIRGGAAKRGDSSR